MTVVIESIVELGLLVIFIRLLYNNLTHGTNSRGESTLLLTALVLAVLLPTTGPLLGIPEDILTVISSSLFLSQSYLVLLLASRFTKVPITAILLAAGVLALAFISAIWLHDHFPLLFFIALFVVYVGMEGYAMWLFTREIRKKRGVVPRRMHAISIGTGAMVLAVILLVSSAVFGFSFEDNRPLVALLALVASVEYVIGFTPPGWLVHMWQAPEIVDFIRSEPALRDTQAAFVHLARTALNITAAKAVGVGQPMDDGFTVHWYLPHQTDLQSPMQLDPDVARALSAFPTPGTPAAGRPLKELSQDLRDLADACGAQSYTSVPIGDEERPVGFLLVLEDREFPISDDGTDLLGHLCRHTALTVDNVRLLTAAKREATRLTAVNDVMKVLMRPRDPDVLAHEIVPALAAAVQADVAELFILDSEGYLSRVARTPEADAPLRWTVQTGVVGLALERGEVMYFEDVQGDERFVRQAEAHLEGYRSVLSVPLVTRGTSVGVYTLIHKHVHRYTEDEQDILRSLGAPIAISIRNAMLHRTSELRLKQFTTLHESAVALALDLSVEDLLVRIADAGRRLTGARYGALATLDEGRQVDHFVTSGVTDAEIPHNLTKPTARGLLGDVLFEGKSLRITDIREHPRASGLPAGHPPMRSFLGVPITYGDDVLGMLYAGDAPQAEFTQADESALKALAALAAVAITNASLFARSEEARRAAEQANAELAEANRAKSDFLASMSHELRTPLNAILGFTELMLDDDDLALDRRRHYIDTVHSSGEHLLGLINNILDLSKVEAGRMDLQVEDFDAALAIREVLTAVEPLAAQAGLRLEANAEPQLHVQADRGKFKQILYNLVANAIKFTPASGRILVEGNCRQGEFVLAVTDSGIGIAPENQERIFEAFQQVDGSSERQYQGTGLGLALVRQLVALHGGSVTLQSQVGQGSRFEVCLPLKDGAAASEAAAAQSPSLSDDAPLVLVVEDDSRSEAILRHLLEGAGYRVAAAKSGEEALVKAKALHPTVITLDVLLPGIDGWGVLDVLKQDAQTKDLPVVVVTVVDDRQRAYALGAADYFVKPVDREVLLDHLARYTKSSSQHTVLAIDDDPSALELVAEILGGAGYRVITSTDGREGLEMARTEPPDAILLDLMMPGMSGFEVIEALRGSEATAKVPVLVLTAHDLSQEDKQQLSRQALAVLRKNQQANADLVQWVRYALGADQGGARP